jgi:formate dehydrogenase major subunit
MQPISRRDFLKLSGGAATGVIFFKPWGVKKGAKAPPKNLPLKALGEITTICPFDGSGCGFIVASENGKVTNIEGDPDHPINHGAGCAKGQSIRQLAADNPQRLSKVMYRAPGASAWQEKSWDWAITEIAQRIKAARDSSFVTKDSAGLTVNRTEAIANLGGAALDNEECYLLSKMSRSLGIVYLEHQARL